MAAIDIPHFCAENGHRLLATGKEGEALRFEIELRPFRSRAAKREDHGYGEASGVPASSAGIG